MLNEVVSYVLLPLLALSFFRFRRFIEFEDDGRIEVTRNRVIFTLGNFSFIVAEYNQFRRLPVGS